MKTILEEYIHTEAVLIRNCPGIKVKIKRWEAFYF